MGDTEKIKQALEKNQESLYVIPLDDLYEEYKQRKLRNSKTLAGLAAPARDSLTANKICRELGIMGRTAVTTAANGRSYVTIKGYPGLRSVLTGTRYLETNPKVVNLAIGRVGLAASIVEGSILTMVLYVGIDILECILNEHSTLGLLSATLATDLLKVGISSIVAAIIGTAIGGTATIAALPLVIAILVGVGTNYILEKIDEQFGITDKLASAIDKQVRKAEEEFSRGYSKLESGLLWKLYHININKLRGY